MEPNLEPIYALIIDYLFVFAIFCYLSESPCLSAKNHQFYCKKWRFSRHTRLKTPHLENAWAAGHAANRSPSTIRACPSAVRLSNKGFTDPAWA